MHYILYTALFERDNKCEYLVFGSKAQLSKIDVQSISFSGHTINLSQTCRNLGVIFDFQLDYVGPNL